MWGVPGGERGNIQTRGGGDRVSTISLLGCSTSVVFDTGPTDEEEEESTFMQPLLQWQSNEYYTTWRFVFVALRIQNAMHMHHIVVRGLPQSTLFVRTISKTARFSKEKKLPNTERLSRFSLQIFRATFLILRRNERHMIKICTLVCMSSTLYPLSELNETQIISTDFRKIPKYRSRKIWPVGAKLFRADGQTDTTWQH